MTKLLTTIFILLFSLNSWGQTELEDISIVDTLSVQKDIFEGNKPLNFTLIFDIKKFQRGKHKKEFFDAQLLYHLNDSVAGTKDIRIKARGVFRNQYCSLPPFYLNIKKADIKNQHLSETNKIKFVTHCRGGKSSVNYVFKEYLAYKIYNIISPYSFRTKLVKIKYIDTGRRNRETDTWGFIIEPPKMMADRLNAYHIKMDNLGMVHMDTTTMDIAALFQYMIGNADYSITGRHNMKIIKLKDINKPIPIPVPYDFDYTGFINAAYAVPGENLGITSVTQRYYLGPCRTVEQYKKTINYFKTKEKEILNIVESDTLLNDYDRTEALNYLISFFNDLDNPNFIKNRLKKTCNNLE